MDPTKFSLARSITRENANAFIQQHRTVLGHKGCYLFAIKAGKGLTPFYVGKATKSYAQEVLTDHKRGIFNEVLADYGKGSPVLILISLNKRKGKTPSRVISDVEKYLTTLAYRANSELKNIKNIPKSQPWKIPGVMHTGKGNTKEPVKALKRCLSL